MGTDSGERPTRSRDFAGAWLFSVRVDQPPVALARESINPLAADALASFLADGTLLISVSPSFPVPDRAIQADRLLVGHGHGSWVLLGEGAAALRCAAVLYVETGNPVATVFVDASVRLGPDDTFSGPYTIESHLTRGWTRNLPSLDGSVQGWRVGAPASH